MEKIIGGQELENPISAGVQQKILWPCYEFIAHAEGLDNFEKNIIEEVVLKLAAINVRSDAEIAECTGLDDDLISFMHSRLQQKGLLDETCGITDEGKMKLEEFAEKHSQDIHIYVDALSGRVLPYWAPVSERNNFHYDGGRWDRKDDDNPDKPLFFRYKAISSAGMENDEEQAAYPLRFEKDSYNSVPEVDDVSAMLHTLFPKNDSIVVRIDESQDCEKNLCYCLMEILLPEGNTRRWVCTDGFGKLSTFFSTDFITDAKDKEFLSGLRSNLQSGTNAAKSEEKPAPEEYPRLAEKLSLVQKSMSALELSVDSPDKEEELRMARNDVLLYMTQLAEWAFHYILHRKYFEYKAREILSDFEKFRGNKASAHIIGKIAEKKAVALGFSIESDCKKSLRERYGRILSAFENTPSLFALVDLCVISLSDEMWLKDFAKNAPDFLLDLALLNKMRNESFHAGNTETNLSQIHRTYKEILLLLKAGLGIEINSESRMSFAERHEFQNERISAIARMEDALGFTLCHILDNTLLGFFTDMERRSPDKEHLNNAVILDMYRILESVFVQVNEGLGDENKKSDWREKVRSAGFVLDGGAECKALLSTNEDRIQIALERKPSSMNAACIAFLTLSDIKLLKELKNKWRTLPADVSYIVRLRGHGEIPDSIDEARVWEIKAHITDLICFFAEKGFLSQKNVN